MGSIGFKGAHPAYPEREARPARPLTLMDLLSKARELGVGLAKRMGARLGRRKRALLAPVYTRLNCPHPPAKASGNSLRATSV